MKTAFFCTLLTVAALLPLAPTATAQATPKQLETVAAAYAKAGQLNGTVLVAEHGRVIFVKGYGLANREWNQPNAADTKFRLGSLTKQFTAMLVMQLVEKGKLRLDAPVSNYLPDYPQPNGEKITIHHLLTHTAGIPNYTAQASFQAVSILPTTPAAFVRSFAGLPLEFEPGSKFNYSNSGYFLLGEIIEKVTGKPYAQVLTENILGPLHMQDTGYDLPGTILPKRAAGYEKSGTAIRNADYLDMTVPYAAGSLYSTVLDLVKWDQALAGTQLLSEASKTLLFKPFKHNYAYGWGVGKFVVGSDTLQLLSHDGGINGFGTTITRLPQRQALVVVLDNEGGEQAGRLGGDLLRVLYHKAPKGPEPASPGASTAALASAAAPAVAAASTAPATAAMTSPVAAAENAAALAAYVGRYEVAPTFSITVKEQSGQLTAQATGQQPFGLVAMAPGRFRVPVLAAEVEFVRNAAGKVEKLVLHQDGHHSPGRKVE